MESEKVKDKIRELIDCDKKQNDFSGIFVVNRQFLIESLTLINELEVLCNKTYEDLTKEIDRLESENKQLRLERDVLIGKKIVEKQKSDKALMMKIDIQEQLKDRIAELEKENAIKTDTIVDLLKKQEFYEKEKLTKFAERLKEELKGIVGGNFIDETLKEFIKD